MKELNESAKVSREDTELHAQKQVKKETKLIGKLGKIPGLTLFEYNTKTFSLNKAEYKKGDLIIDAIRSPKNRQNGAIRFSVVIKEDCYYIQALNRKVAEKKLGKAGFTKFLK